MPNRDTDNIPTISLDQADRDAFYRSRQSTSSPNVSKKTTEVNQSSSSGTIVLGIFSLLVALAAGGACYWLYDLNQKQQIELSKNQQRISELEQTLSATGEEIGESTVAMQVKVGKLVEKTDKLWQEMDKLWASAWRKNQSQIKALTAKSDNQYKDGRKLQQNVQTSLDKTQNSLNQTQTSLELLREQLDMQRQNSSQLSQQLAGALTQLAQLKQSNSAANKQVVNLQEDLVSASSKNRSLASRLLKLEQWQKSQQGNKNPTP